MQIQLSNAYAVNSITSAPKPQAELFAESAATVTDTASISPAAKELYQSSFAGISAEAHKDPAFAKDIAYGQAHSLDQPWVNIAHGRTVVDGVPFPMGKEYYSVTGEEVTAESQAKYDKISERLLGEKLALYDAEKEKGTPEADIVDKIIALMDQQPQDFLELLNWQGVTGRA